MEKDLLGSLELNRIYQFDCVEGMKLIPENSIDLTVTSPPYDQLRDYKGYSFNFEEVAQELYRITSIGGVLVWVVGDSVKNGSETLTSFKHALYFKEIGFNAHDTMIFEKSTSPFPERNRYNQKFEYMFIFSKGKPKVANLLKEIARSNLKRLGKQDGSYRKQNGEIYEGKYESRKKEKTKGNIWYYAVGMNCTTKDKFAFEHPAMFPEKLAEDHILSWSNEHDIVFDPFIGSGTTAKMAQINNRKWLGFEVSPEYIEIANKRLDDLVGY
ncbi:DNA-methyltransferase [Bacillus altitudinis]|uniref:DNA-methyltransferase n=1 Tax=Bacillus altitudinis TaxID=293387 RepID=UPI0011A16A85|nr:site-specific DNA-methyltransferase [Bacillus altitudinis]